MKLVMVGMVLLLVTGCSAKDLQQTYEVIKASAEEVPLNNDEVVAALKDALSRGISRAAVIASQKDGYYANPRLKIEFPPDLREVEKTLRKVGLGKEVDRFVKQLNRGAEKAAATSKTIFIKAITGMKISDGFRILNGQPDAATRYLYRKTGGELYARFLPIISSSLEETSATRYYGDLVRKYNRLPYVKDIDPDLEGYATEMAIAGLFVFIADEEASIRANPAARTTHLLRRVFGSLD